MGVAKKPYESPRSIHLRSNESLGSAKIIRIVSMSIISTGHRRTAYPYKATQRAQCQRLLHTTGFSDVSVGWELDSRGSIWVPWNRRLQGLAQPSDDAGHVASTSIAATASAWRAHRRHPHNVAFDQLQCVQSREQLRGARETLEAAHGPDACLHVAMIPLAAIGRDHEVVEPRGRV